MKIELNNPIDEGDVIRKSLTVLYKIVYSDKIVTYFKDGIIQEIPINGLLDQDASTHNAWLTMINSNIKGEYQSKTITTRNLEKMSIIEEVK